MDFFTQRILQIEEGFYLEAPLPLEPTDCFNHSCDPNVGFTGQIGLVAMRDIHAGEELNFDYAMCDGSVYDEFDCYCGSGKCRGQVKGTDWSLPELWEKYDGYFMPYLAQAHRSAQSQSTGQRIIVAAAAAASQQDTDCRYNQCNPCLCLKSTAFPSQLTFKSGPPGETMPDKTGGKSFALRIYIVALILRLIPVLLARGLGIGLDDMFQYDMLARSLAAGNGFRWYAQQDLNLIAPYVKFDLSTVDYDPIRGIPTSFRAPLYPIISGLGLFHLWDRRLHVSSPPV